MTNKELLNLVNFESAWSLLEELQHENLNLDSKTKYEQKAAKQRMNNIMKEIKALIK